MKKFQAEGFPAFNQIDGEVVILSAKDEADRLNDFKLKEQKDYPKDILYSQLVLMKLIGKKVKLTLEVLDDVV